VLGVDPIKNLVVPRFLALMITTGLFNIYALIFGIFGGVLATLTFHAPTSCGLVGAWTRARHRSRRPRPVDRRSPPQGWRPRSASWCCCSRRCRWCGASGRCWWPAW